MALHILDRNDNTPARSAALPLSTDYPLTISQALQTTLDLNELLAIFLERISALIPLDALSFRLDSQGVILSMGSSGRHQVGYELKMKEEALGHLTFMRRRRFSSEEMASLEELIVLLFYPLRNALRYRAALQAAFIDPLTTAGNRAALEQNLKREVELACRHHNPLSLLVIDLDHFKRINDTHGHQSGDEVLRETAQRLKEALRSSDLLYRFGGEEFVVVLSNTPLEGALQVAERIRAAIADTPYRVTGKALHVTTSIGVALCAEQDSPLSLFEKGDRALYRAKALGRNQVMQYEA